MSADYRLWVCTDHDAHWPVGVASVIVATDMAEAEALLGVALRERGLKPEAGFTLEERRLDEPFAEVLCDGNY